MSEAARDRPYTVVVGVSATSKSPAALAWAAAQAKANDGRLIAVRVLKRPAGDAGETTPAPGRPGRESQQADLAADVAEALGPDNGAECQVLYGGRRRGLLTVAEGADLLVIDAARTPSSTSRLAHRVIAEATCPVVVLPLAMTGEPSWGITKAARSVGEAALRAVGSSGRPGYRPPERP
jgi:nucleotide-binding universal stress UspA family protein